MRTRIPALVLVLAAAQACSDAPAPAGGAGGHVVASIHPLGALVRELVGPETRVSVLLPPGADAHTYEPTPRAAEALAGADLIVRIGAGVDDWVAAGDAGARVAVLSEGIELHGGTPRGGGNPHIWLDPILVRDRLLPRLADELAAALPAQEADIRERARTFRDSLTALDREISALLASVPTHRFIAAHPAWIYFAERYGLEQVGVIHPSPGEEIGTRELARLVQDAASREVRAVIAEPQLGRAGVAAVAEELDVAVEVADPVGTPGVQGRDRYLDLMRANARAFARALGGTP